MTCRACGTRVLPDARFCHACGTPLSPVPGESERGDRRLVTVLFGDLSGFTSWAEELDPERVGVVVDRVLAALSQAVIEVGGYVDKLTGDGIMAVFGAPRAHEDDAERAVQAAAAMQAAVRRLAAEETGGTRPLGLRVGLNTGEVLAGVQAGLAYTVVGDTVNTAARLADAAGVGAVYAGAATAAATSHHAVWHALPPLRLKGKREPVTAYELVALRAAGGERLGPGEDAPFVGRDGELALLVERFLRVIERRAPETAVVVGEPGIGKTRLAVELSGLAAARAGARVLWGRCPPYGTGRDLAPLVDWVRAACDVRGDAYDEAAAAQVRRAVAALDLPQGGLGPVGTADRLLGLLDLPRSRTPREAATPGGDERRPRPLVAALSALLSGLAGAGPLLLVADDLHCAGGELLGALGALSSTLSGPVLLLLVGRQDPPPGDGAAWWTRLSPAALARLGPLEAPAGRQLLHAMLGGGSLDETASRLLLERTQGNPFFLAETLHLLVDRGLLRRVGDRWTLADPLPDILPAGVQAVLAARIDGLDPSAKAVLRAVSVLGAEFPAAAVARVAAPDPVGAGLVTLVERGLLRARPDGSYAFAHALARDVAYAGMPKTERARRHAAAAAWAATWAADAEHSGWASPADRDAFVADQAERAVALAGEMRLPDGDPAWSARPVAVAALVRLGEAALRRDDLLGADRLLTRALALADAALGAVDPRLVAQAHVARAAARVPLHRLDDADQDLAGALDADDPALRARGLVVAGDLRRRRGDDRGAVIALVSALAAAADAGDDRVTGEALRHLGLVDYFAGRLRSAEERFAAALDLAQRVGDERGAGWALQHLAWSATTRGDYGTAERMLTRAAQLFAALDDVGGLSWCGGTEAFVRVLQGRFAAARASVAALLPAADALGQRWGAAACLTMDALAAAELGDLAAAREEAARAQRLLRELGDLWGLALALVAEGVAHRYAGDTGRAVALLREAVRLAEQGGHPVVASFALVLLGYCHLDRGEVGAAESAAARAVGVLGGLELEPHAVVGASVLLAHVLRARGQRDRSLALLEEAAAATAEPTLLFPRRQALAHWAAALLDAGRVAQARAAVNRARREPGEDVPSAVLTLRVHAAVCEAEGDGPGARAALVEALALASRGPLRNARAELEAALTARGGFRR
ncbi:MAG: adenylate/guanylate cyclase domain-containing protein [Mycobacterium leprae]